MDNLPETEPENVAEPEPVVARRGLRGPNAPVIALICLHAALALTLSLTMLLGYAPDEPRHFAYVRWLAEHHTIPPADEALSGNAHSLHSPLYYLTMLPLYWVFAPFGDEVAMRAMRCAAPLIGALALWLLVPVLRRMAGSSRGLWLFMLAMLAVWPNLSLCVAMVNNDAASVLTYALFLNVMLVRRWDTRLSSAAIWGALLGLTALAKFSGFIAGAGALAFGLMLVHGRGFLRKEDFWKGGFVAGVSCLAVCGWWWVRNLLVYGALNPYPSIPTLPETLSPLDAVIYGYAWPFVLRAVNGLWGTTWPTVGWAPDGWMPGIHAVLLVLTVGAVIGALLLILRRRGADALAPDQTSALVVTAAGYGLMLLALFYVATFKHLGTYQNGRYLMPFVVGLVGALALSWREIIPSAGRKIAAVLVVLFFIFLNVASWVHLVTYWNPLVGK